MKNNHIIPIRDDNGDIQEFIHDLTGEVITPQEVFEMHEADKACKAEEDSVSTFAGSEPNEASLEDRVREFRLACDDLACKFSNGGKVISDRAPKQKIGETDTGHWETPWKLSSFGDIRESTSDRHFVVGAGCKNEIFPYKQISNLEFDPSKTLSKVFWTLDDFASRILDSIRFEAKPPAKFLQDINTLLNFAMDGIRLSYGSLTGGPENTSLLSVLKQMDKEYVHEIAAREKVIKEQSDLINQYRSQIKTLRSKLYSRTKNTSQTFHERK